MRQTLGMVTSGLATLTRFGRGIFSKPIAIQPDRLLELYEFENCPYCRLVREVLTELNLDAIIYPCPKGGQRFRARAVQLGGKAQFPMLVDPNTDELLYESTDIIAYLVKAYGQGKPDWKGRRFKSFDVVSSALASGYRAGAGLRVRPSKEPSQPLELYSFESSPYARRVREALCELELPYVLRNVGRTQLIESIPPSARDFLGLSIRPTSAKRQAFLERSGRMMVPYLIDPNTNTEMFESTAIRDYLMKTYAD